MAFTQHQMQAFAANDFLLSARQFLVSIAQHSEACADTQRDARDILDAMTSTVASDANFPVVVQHLRGTINDIHAMRLDMELLESRTDGYLVERYARGAEHLVEEAKSVLSANFA